MNEHDELYKRFRPTLFKHIIGQEAAVDQLESMLKRQQFPHATLFHGPSGCGKTTLARICKVKLGCDKNVPEGGGDVDFVELNSANFRGIDTVRDIQRAIGLSCRAGDCRVWLVDECHKLTDVAQDAFLKMLEDTPRHVYFMLCTTEPSKLKNTIRTRCTEIAVTPLNNTKMQQLLSGIAVKSHLKLEEEVMDKLVKAAEGSPRKALVLLHQIMSMESKEDQIKAILDPEVEKQAIDLARLLMDPGSSWKSVQSCLKKITEEPETIRAVVLGYCSSVLRNDGRMNGCARANYIVNCFRDPFYEKKALLDSACYEIVCRKG